MTKREAELWLALRALTQYANHKRECPTRFDDFHRTSTCTCGFIRELVILHELLGPEIEQVQQEQKCRQILSEPYEGWTEVAPGLYEANEDCSIFSKAK